MGKKAKQKNQKPVDARKAFKGSAHYIKPQSVSVSDIGGSKYRKKLIDRKREAMGDTAALGKRW